MLKVPAFESNPYYPKIKIIGVGDTGYRIINKMVREQIRDIEFIAINSETQTQATVEAAMRIQIGRESRDEIKQTISGIDLLVIIAGLGDCASTSSGELVAEIARESGVLTIAMVTTPFSFEGMRRSRVAKEGIARLLRKVDSLFIIHNNLLMNFYDRRMDANNAFKMSDKVFRQAVRAIVEIVTVDGLIQLDFTDFKTVMKDAGTAWISIGRGMGDKRATDAAKEALASPLFDVSIHSTKSVLFKIVGSADLTLYDVNQAAEVIKQSVDPETNIIFGVDRDPAIGNEVRITLIGTGS